MTFRKVKTIRTKKKFSGCQDWERERCFLKDITQINFNDNRTVVQTSVVVDTWFYAFAKLYRTV